MKSDIDRLMQERELDALMIIGGEGENPHRHYLTNGAKASALVLKKRGETPVMIVSGMEVEEARKSGLNVVTFSELKLHELWQEYKEDRDMRLVKHYERFLGSIGFTAGRLGVYGRGDVGVTWETLKLLAAHYPAIEFVGEHERSIFEIAAITKDAAEIALLRDVGRRTNAVMQAAWDYIAGHCAAADETVIKADGSPLTVGDVKRFVRQKLLENGLEEGGHEMIFAPGRDGGFPHSRGEANTVLKLGQAIVFDLFPRDVETGYYHDMTRTWSIGYASDAVQRAFTQVQQAFDAVMDTLALGERTQKYQLLTMDIFEEHGHPTPRSHSGTEIGYCHSLGHGLGLEIHESPAFTHLRDDDALEAGNVFTVEPGLYYPDQGYGVRIEDTVYMDEKGVAHSLTPMHKKLVLELTGA